MTNCKVVSFYTQEYWKILGSGDSLLVRALDPWSKGCRFESRQGRRENFLLYSQLCVLTLIRCPFHPRVTAVARKTTTTTTTTTTKRSFCQKCRWQVTPKHVCTLDPTKWKVDWLCRCPGIVWEPTRKRAHMQLVREHLVTVISAHWATGRLILA